VVNGLACWGFLL